MKKDDRTGQLVDLLVPAADVPAIKAASREWVSWTLTPRQLCDLELLGVGGFSPLRGFMGRRDYEAVRDSLRLASGEVWPIPITLDVSEPVAKGLKPGDQLALRDPEGVMVGVLTVGDVWQPDRAGEAEAVYGTLDPEHPGVGYILHRAHSWYVGGALRVVQHPTHYDFRALRLSPRQVRAALAQGGWERVVGFQTRNPMHRAHQEVTLRAAATLKAHLLIHPVVGQTKPGDIDHYTRVRCYEAIMPRYPEGSALLALLPLAMRMAGPREAVWHALIRKNYGCTHFIVGRDHASPGKNARGTHFYGRYDAQDLFRKFEGEIGVGMIAFERLLYVPSVRGYVSEREVPPGAEALTISGTEFRQRLAAGDPIPEWFSFPEVVRELRRTHPPRSRQGVTVMFTGLSGAGKSTIANIVSVRLRERGGRQVTMLDGDVVRRNLSSELGFSKSDRDTNIRRIAFVAAEVTRHGGIALCAPIAPYDAVRREARALISALGGFVLVHVAAPLAICEERDRKGLYAKARAGQIPDFTGMSDPYEAPGDAELVLDSGVLTAEAAADQVLQYLEQAGYLGDGGE